MAIYRGSVKTAGIGRSFNPGNLGCECQVLTRTQCGYSWEDPQGGNSGPMVDVLVVGGGGGGGGGCCSNGGGGGGGVKECSKYLLNGTNISVTVGAGGNGGTTASTASNGGISCFGNLISRGGGRGGTANYIPGYGGNGGGTANNGNNCQYGLDGGYRGGISVCSSYGGGGGGGAGGPGQDTFSCRGGFGGPGVCSNIFCCKSTPYCFFGTGGAGSGGGGLCGLVANFTGGGNSGAYVSGGTFYGGGGGGGKLCSCSNCAGGNGYQGVVMIRYPTDGSYGFTSSTGGDCCFTCNGYCYVEFTTVGTSTFCITG